MICDVEPLTSRVELTSPTVGVVKRLGADEGVVLKVGEVVCDIETDSGDVAETENTREVEVKSSPETTASISEPLKRTTTQPTSEEHSLDESPSDESLHQSRDDLLDTAPGAQFSGEAAMLPSPPPFSPSPLTPASSAREERRESRPWSELRKIVKASPAVRTLAARMGVELTDVRGSGEGGRVLRDDITSHADTSASVSHGEVVREAAVRGLKRDEIPVTTRVEFGRTRKVMYRAMGDMGSVPHFG